LVVGLFGHDGHTVSQTMSARPAGRNATSVECGFMRLCCRIK
jgi:hypothetical protein